MNKLYGIFLTIVGAVIYRIRGGLVPAFPRPMDQLLFALPYGAIAYKASNRNKIVFGIVMVLTMAACATGHGAYMDLGRWTQAVSPESLDFIVSWFFGADNFHNFWRDGFGLALTGLVVTLPAGLFLLYNAVFEFKYSYLKPKLLIPSIALTLSGALKFPAYYIGWELFGGTEGGEFLTGGMLWGVAIWVYSKI